MLFSFTAAAQVKQEEVDRMLIKMVRENIISHGEADKIRVRLTTMSPEEWSEFTREAHEQMSHSESSENLDEAQMETIQNDLQKIAPHYDQN